MAGGNQRGAWHYLRSHGPAKAQVDAKVLRIAGDALCRSGPYILDHPHAAPLDARDIDQGERHGFQDGHCGSAERGKIHAFQCVDPDCGGAVADAEVIETELMLADMESIEKRLVNIVRKVRGGDKEAVQQERLLKDAMAALENGKPARTVDVDEDDLKQWKMLQLLTSKPILYVCNVDEGSSATGNAFSEKVAVMAAEQGAATVVISAQIEEEISQLEDDEAAMFLEEMGLEEAGLNRLIRAGYELLHLETYFTVGPKEARAWTIKQGTGAPQAAGVIHGDFEKGFIRAETIAYDDYVELGGEQPSKEAGKMRAEGKGYVVKDGDVLHFLFNN